jgi:regulator of protease activity HflC (stomatin/prohibitin superfamily)
MVVVYVLIVVALVVLVGTAPAVRVLKQYERAVLFRLGRVSDGAATPRA